MLRGGSAPLRKTLARQFHHRFKRTLSSSSLTDALNLLEAQAGELEPEQVHLRVAPLPRATGFAAPSQTSGAAKPENTVLPIEEQEQEPNEAPVRHETPNTKHETLLKHQTPGRDPNDTNKDGIALDLGRPDGRAVIVTASGWQILDRSPVLFRRTPLSDQLPLPVSGGTLDQLRSLINVSDEGWQLLRGWLVAALFPSIAHPILLLGGQQGTGKSTALRMLSSLVDPSAAPLRSEPHDSENWVMMAHGSWCVALDNISSISPWFSDALCKAVTGDGFVRRRLYTDGDFNVLEFRRVVALTSIHPGTLAGDLADRLLYVELDPIDESSRLPETELLARFEALKPQIFGALLDEVAATLRRLPSVHLDRLPRMADFARLLAALPPSSPLTPVPSPLLSDGIADEGADNRKALADKCDPKNAIQDNADNTDKCALAIYLSQNLKLASEVIEGDPVAVALSELMQSWETWQGTAAELLLAMNRSDSGRNWPRTPQAIGGHLKRLAPALRTMGITIDYQRANDRMRTRRIHLTAKPIASPEMYPQPAQRHD